MSSIDTDQSTQPQLDLQDDPGEIDVVLDDSDARSGPASVASVFFFIFSKAFLKLLSALASNSSAK